MIELLRRAISQHFAKNRPSGVLIAPLWLYLHRTCKRFDALVRRWRAGKLKPRPARGPRPEAEPPEPRPKAPRPPRLPDKFGWVFWLVPEAVHGRLWLENLVADPEIAALLAVSPQAVRLLRPLCWMLGLEVAPDRPPVLFSRARPQRETPESVGFLRPPLRGWWMRRHPDGSREARPPPPGYPFKLA